MYSDRVDSVTRATNPSLLPSLPSTLLALLVRRPPPPPSPSPNASTYKAQSLDQTEFFLRCSSLFLSLFLITYSRLVFRPSHPLVFLTHSPRLVRFFSILIPFRRIPILSWCFFHYFISLYLPFSRVSHSFFLFLPFATRYLATFRHLGNSRV